jgi:hypothetical protein
MSLVFQNIDPSLRPARVSSPRNTRHSPGGERGGGSIFWNTRDIGLPSYSNNLSTQNVNGISSTSDICFMVPTSSPAMLAYSNVDNVGYPTI